ncbi:glycosyltransferase [Calothrix sp. 336/3]|nr:glycosyltransferase [Calothrix sp. 336/3]
MLSKLRFNGRRLHYLSLLLLLLPLLFLSSGQSSLMAHDEGLYAWRSRLMLESGDWINPWSEPHHKTPGFYWLLALSYKLLGMNEMTVRLPVMIAGMCCLLLVYEIGRIIYGEYLAWLAGAILTGEFLWVQYARLGTPDMPMMLLVLLAIFCLLQGEREPQKYYFYGFIAGFCLGLGFLVRSFMIILPTVALFPYLITENNRHRHLYNPLLYLGYLLGLIPTLVWLWLSSQRYQARSTGALLNFVVTLGSGDRGNNGLEFYFWNLPLKSFPWCLFAVLGLILLLRHPLPRYQLLIVGFPLTLFTELTLFSTRLSHYSLCVYPFIALLAAVGLAGLGEITTFRQRVKLSLSYIFGIFGVILFLAGIAAVIIGNGQIPLYGMVAIAVGGSWLCLLRWQKYSHQSWIASWLVATWLGLAVAAVNGFFNDYNPDVKAFIQQPAIAPILQNHPVHFLPIGGKTAVLLNFYTPHHGKRVDSLSQLPSHSYVWIPKDLSLTAVPHRVLGNVQTAKLIEVLPPN